MDRDFVKKQLRADENEIPYAYKDHLGYWTIGVGHLIDQQKGGRLSKRIIDLILEEDIDEKMKELDMHMPFWKELKQSAQHALLFMTFQMGIGNVMAFKNMVEALKKKDYEGARLHALDSKWAKIDTPERAKRVTDLFIKPEVTS